MQKLLYLPWAEPLLEEQTNTDSAERSRHALLSSLMEAKDAVQVAHAPFAARGDVRPIHCRKALNALERLDECIQTTCQYLQEPILQERDAAEADLLSARISSSYYQLLTPLYYAQEQASLLIDSIDAHRLVCFTQSEQSGQQRRAIQEQFAMLEHYLTTLFDRFQSFDEDRKCNKQK